MNINNQMVHCLSIDIHCFLVASYSYTYQVVLTALVTLVSINEVALHRSIPPLVLT